MDKYNYKLVICGNMIQMYIYEFSIGRGWPRRIRDDFTEEDFFNDGIYDTAEQKKQEAFDEIECLKKKQKIITKTDVQEGEYKREKRNIQRCKRDLKRLVWSNLCQYPRVERFITLTFKNDENGNPPIREKVISEFKYFRKKFQRKYGDSFEYLMVIERGERGTHRLHIHFLAFGLGVDLSKDDLYDLWGNGWVDIQDVTTYDNTINYLLKYVEKTLEDEYIGKGQKFYMTSRGLKKPEVRLMDVNEIADFFQFNEVGELRCQVEGFNDYIGRFKFKEYINRENIYNHLEDLWKMNPTIEVKNLKRKPILTFDPYHFDN